MFLPLVLVTEPLRIEAIWVAEVPRVVVKRSYGYYHIHPLFDKERLFVGIFRFDFEILSADSMSLKRRRPTSQSFW
jgi:hypothetical protein